MTADELIGSTAAAVIAQLAHSDEASGSTARFLLDRLTEAQVAAVCKAIAAHPALSSEVQMRIPRSIGAAVGLPDAVLTDERSTFWRHAECQSPILVLANTEDDQGQSLKDVTAVGSNELLASPGLWVERAAQGSHLPDSQIKWWSQALRGLLDAKPLSLDSFAKYILATRAAIDEGLPIVEALGRALSALRAPRDSAYFNAIPKAALGHAIRWRRLYQKLFTSRAPYLVKIAPNQQPIAKETLSESFEKIKDEIDPKHHPLFLAFIESESNWNTESQRIAELEWEQDKVKSLFDGLKVKREPLGQATLDYYDDEFPISLSEDDHDYLQRLDQRNTREASEEDSLFYEQHRFEVAQNRTLKLKWEKFVFGQPLETDDFLVGFLRVLERLYEQAGGAADERKLTIECRRSKREWLEMNHDAVTYFVRSYRGLQSLTHKQIHWDVPHLFDFNALIRDEERKGRYERTQTTKRAANQIKFIFRLHVKRSETESDFSSQIIWTFNPESVLAEYDEDWRRLKDNPFTRSRVNREIVSPKGKLQSLDLRDASTMMPVFRQDRGSLVSAYDADQDLQARFKRELENAFLQHRISAESKDALLKSWAAFSADYLRALEESAESGSAAEVWIKQSDSYRDLLEKLAVHAVGDRNRIELWEPVLSIGATAVDGGPPCAIIAPWHPLRMLSAAVKVRSIAGLTRYLLDSESVNFGDARMFFRDLAAELGHPYYPEVCFTMSGNQPVLLSISQTCGEYSMMEPPCRTADGAQSPTNDDPRSAAAIIIRLLRRYLELQPHEEANLTAVLYNCDSARLPQAVVEEFSSLYEDGNDEVRCQIVLRHGDPKKLNELYGTLLKASEDSSDLFVGSEASRDFMSRLRISIMADQAQVPSEMSGPPTDLVFLHDVIARGAELSWIDEGSQHSPVDVLHHVPPRWSKRKPSARDDLRSTTYLTCPLQPAVGWAYLRLLHGALTGNDGPGHYLPARRISFQDNKTREVFDEVHRLGQWVVNYDELLTKRQLRSLGVQVIRYQKLRDEDRNLLISSTAPLNLLNVLVQKRLRTFSLGLTPEELQVLASRMLDHANEISGDIVLRAAKHGCFANELIGLVLSKFLIEDELESNQHIGWFFLDDYADWLGQKEEHIADILALSPQIVDGRHRLVGVVGEAKLVGADGVAKARRTSEVQLRETLARIQDAIFGDPGRLDRDLWLGRFADLLLDGVEISPGEPLRIEAWRDAIREGRVEIVLQGYSHVFVHEDGTDRLDSSRSEIPKVNDAWQETYSRDAVRDLLLRFHSGKSPRDIRGGLGWTPSDVQAKTASPRVMWTVSDETSSDQATNVRTDSEGGAAATPTTSQKEKPRDARAVTDKEPSQPPENEEGGSHPPETAFAWATPKLRETLSSLTPVIPQGSGGAEWLAETTKKLRGALLTYGFQAKLLDQRLTPNAALVRFQGSDRLKLSDVDSRRSQLLTTHELRVIRVAAEPGAVVVTIARPEREIVSLVDVLRQRKVDDPTQRINQSLVVGIREATGQILYLAPGKAHAPHTLVAGTTGSGKSVLLQNLILDIAMTNSSLAAHITLIDPKQGVDYFELEPIPHLGGRVVVDQQGAQQVLEAMVAEMDNRYRMFRAARVGNISEYNRQAPPERIMPILWLVHDEFAEWMLVDTYKDVVSSTVQRLGIKARAAGIFLIFAAQRPEDKVMPVQLRDNLGNRLVLRVESEGTSRIALLEEGAERLLGKGHLAARLQGEDELVIAQVPILDADAIRKIVKTISE